MKIPRTATSPNASPPPQVDEQWLQMAAAQMHQEGRLDSDAASRIDQSKKMKRDVEDNQRYFKNTDDMDNKRKGPVATPGEQIMDPGGLSRDVRIN